MGNIDELKKNIGEKIENGTFSGNDLDKYFQLFSEIGANNEEFQEEIEDWNKTIVFDIDGLGSFWIKTENGSVDAGSGEIEEVDLTLKIKLEHVLKIFSDDLDPGVAFMTGKLKLKGELPDALKFSELMEIVAEEIEYD